MIQNQVRVEQMKDTIR